MAGTRSPTTIFMQLPGRPHPVKGRSNTGRELRVVDEGPRPPLALIGSIDLSGPVTDTILPIHEPSLPTFYETTVPNGRLHKPSTHTAHPNGVDEVVHGSLKPSPSCGVLHLRVVC